MSSLSTGVAGRRVRVALWFGFALGAAIVLPVVLMPPGSDLGGFLSAGSIALFMLGYLAIVITTSARKAPEGLRATLLHSATVTFAYVLLPTIAMGTAAYVLSQQIQGSAGDPRIEAILEMVRPAPFQGTDAIVYVIEGLVGWLLMGALLSLTAFALARFLGKKTKSPAHPSRRPRRPSRTSTHGR